MNANKTDFTPKEGDVIVVYPRRMSPFLDISYICIFKRVLDGYIETYLSANTSNDQISINDVFSTESNTVCAPDKYSASCLQKILKSNDKDWDPEAKLIVDDPEYLEIKRIQEEWLEKCNKKFNVRL